MQSSPLKYPIISLAWAVPINKPPGNGLVDPMEFFDDLPMPPETNATYTYMDKNGKVLPKPSYTDVYLPPYCYVQYVEGCPPPPPEGYRYLRSELQRDMRSPLYHQYHVVGNPRYGVDTPNVMNFAPFELTVQQRSGMESNLIEHPEGFFSMLLGVLITNFTIELHNILCIHGMNGQCSELLEYSVKAKGRYQAIRCKIEIESLDRLPDKIRGSVAGCLMNMQVGKVDAMIVFHVRSQLFNIPRTDEYSCSGWNNIVGVWRYCQKNTEIRYSSARFNTSFQIACDPSMTPRAAMQSAMGMLALSDDPAVIVPLVLYAFLGVLFTLFEQAGFPPRLLLFVNGKTGSLKTAACSVVFNLSGDPKNNIPATFRDTIASVEAKFPTYVDQTLLLDDYSPATTAGNRADMNRLLEAVIRYYGDGKGRGRSNATVTKSTTLIPRGLCCITGEDTGGSQSSLLRCVLIDVANGTLKGDVLAKYQQDPRRWTTVFQHFVDFVSPNFENFAQIIRNHFSERRELFGNVLKAGRLIDSAAFLSLTGDILRSYGESIGYYTKAESAELAVVWNTAIATALVKSEEASSELDPVRFYLSTLFEAVDSGAEYIAPDKETFLRDTGILGYADNGLWHVWPDRVYAMATKRCQLQQKMYPLSITKTHAALGDANLIEVTMEKRKDKLQANYLRRESFGVRPRMLVINKEAAQCYLDT